MRAVLGLATVAVCAAIAGCILFTGGTDGYTTPVPTTGAGCSIPKDCADAGLFCCISGLDAEVPTTSCQTSCGAPSLVICSIASDCEKVVPSADGSTSVLAPCYAQTCYFDDASIPVSTCGVLPICVQ